ncbi:MAG: type II toxin-antitoxin system PemK/MazF family toxin [Chitinophagaceae bacterium]|jgi:mRNA-degrading endonuclease toxin of MazEF toxin-antitoxin module|nr:type II toxin-antitoxin system PemK/MazF family toxin [Chitinophagaceae bacterium]
MRVAQRDIVEVNFLFPDGKMKPHMAIVISNDELNENEGFFYLAMISSKNYNPQYTFELRDDMLSKPLRLKSYVVCQLISGYTERDVIKKCSKVNEMVFVEIVEKIKKTIF